MLHGSDQAWELVHMRLKMILVTPARSSLPHLSLLFPARKQLQSYWMFSQGAKAKPCRQSSNLSQPLGKHFRCLHQLCLHSESLDLTPLGTYLSRGWRSLAVMYQSLRLNDYWILTHMEKSICISRSVSCWVWLRAPLEPLELHQGWMWIIMSRDITGCKEKNPP